MPRINSRQTIKGEVLRWNINEHRKQLQKGGNVRSRRNAVRREHCSRFCRGTRRSSCGQELRLTQGAIKIWDFEQSNPIFHRSKRKFLITGNSRFVSRAFANFQKIPEPSDLVRCFPKTSHVFRQCNKLKRTIRLAVVGNNFLTRWMKILSLGC